MMHGNMKFKSRVTSPLSNPVVSKANLGKLIDQEESYSSDFRLLPRSRRELRSSGLLRSE